LVADALACAFGIGWLRFYKVRLYDSNAYPNSSMRRTPASTAAKSADEASPNRSTRRSFETARIWSVTATTFRPAQVTGISNGGLGCGEDDKGTTTTVRRRSFKIFVDRIRHGRVLAISDPVAGSSLIHQNSPLWGIAPWFSDISADHLELALNRK
jgi:hypothetical protein